MIGFSPAEEPDNAVLQQLAKYLVFLKINKTGFTAEGKKGLPNS
jgi:hypothetical protein